MSPYPLCVSLCLNEIATIDRSRTRLNGGIWRFLNSTDIFVIKCIEYAYTPVLVDL